MDEWLGLAVANRNVEVAGHLTLNHRISISLPIEQMVGFADHLLESLRGTL